MSPTDTRTPASTNMRPMAIHLCGSRSRLLIGTASAQDINAVAALTAGGLTTRDSRGRRTSLELIGDLVQAGLNAGLVDAWRAGEADAADKIIASLDR